MAWSEPSNTIPASEPATSVDRDAGHRLSEEWEGCRAVQSVDGPLC